MLHVYPEQPVIDREDSEQRRPQDSARGGQDLLGSKLFQNSLLNSLKFLIGKQKMTSPIKYTVTFKHAKDCQKCNQIGICKIAESKCK